MKLHFVKKTKMSLFRPPFGVDLGVTYALHL